jgi:hypothetical protein
MTIALKTEHWMLEDRDAVAAHIEAGFGQAQRGQLIDGDAALELLRRQRAERLDSGE